MHIVQRVISVFLLLLIFCGGSSAAAFRSPTEIVQAVSTGPRQEAVATVTGQRRPSHANRGWRGEQDLAPVKPAVTQSPAPLAVETLVSDDLSQGEWTYGGGFLYWTNNCAGGGDPVMGYLKRRAENGQNVQILDQPASCDSLSNYLIADEEGVYYWNDNLDDLEARYTHDPYTIVKLADIAPIIPLRLASDDNWVYYTQPDGIYRASKDFDLVFQTSDAVNVTSLTVDDSYIYWLDDTGLWRSDRSCITSTCWDDKEQLSPFAGEYLSWHGTDRLVWVRSDASNWHISYILLGNPETFNYYSTPTLHTMFIGHAIVHDDTLYWMERSVADDVRLRSKDLPSGLVQDLALGLWLHTPQRFLAAGISGVIFADADGIYRVPYDADPATRDLSLDYYEVTQVIQNLDNDVILVANRPTFVRVYGSIVGVRANLVEVRLHGYRGENELPGSPLASVNGSHPLVEGATIDRTRRYGSWLFHLPEAWTQSGNLRLEAEADPLDLYDDVNLGNNTLIDTFGFFTAPPTCIRWVKVWTNPGIEETWLNPNYGNMLDLYNRLWPSPETHIFKEWDYIAEWQWGDCRYGPYELPGDSWKVLSTLATKDFWSSDPDICDDYGGRTHWVGIVNPDSNTGDTNGAAHMGLDQAWVKFPPDWERPPQENAWDWPRAGQVLAHELGHNYDRKHVDCPEGKPDDTDSGYPYDPCTLDDRNLFDPVTHFGYDINTMVSIPPTPAADLMSYSTLRWDSDYTWEAIFLEMTLGAAQDRQQPPAAVDLSSTASAIMVSGVFTPSLGQGKLDYAWSVPTATLGQGVLSKWQTLAAPSGPQTGPSADPQYHLRLLDASGGLLDDRTITPTETMDTSHPRQTLFMLTLPAPAGDVAQINLLIDDTVVDSLYPGASSPSVHLLQPVGGETIDQKLEIVWRASDPDDGDQLRYIVQYSPDQGQTWHALTANLFHPPGTSTMRLTIEGVGIAGDTTTALVRVLASDGYHTTVATSGPFAVTNRPPAPYIAAPLPGQWVQAGWPVSLRGGASDAEEGNLSSSALSWAIAGSPVGTGSELLVRGLAPGSYDLTLTAQDGAGATADAQARLHISPVHITVAGGALSLDGLCDDALYDGAATLQLSPYDDGSQATIRLARTDTHLWACFGGLRQGTGAVEPFVGIRMDTDHSRDPWAQQDDYGFFVQENGTPFTRKGDGSGGFGLDGPGGLQARIDTQDNTWSAEMRIQESALGGWDHPVGLKLGHYWVGSQGDDYNWPYDAIWNQPDSWATTVLGDLPRIHGLLPEGVTAGSGDVALFVNGEHFVSGAEILWNGEPLPTGFWNDQYVSTIVSATRLTTAGVVTVTVQNPGLEETPSNPSFFTIESPVPTITALLPVSATAGSGSFSLTVNGVDLLPGATVLWDSQACSTTFVSSTQLVAQISASNVVKAGTVAIVARNPYPTESTSQAAYFKVEAGEVVLPFSIYLPVMFK